MQTECKTKEELKDFVIGLREDNLSYSKIAKYLKCSRQNVYYILHHQNVIKRKPRSKTGRRRDKILIRDNHQCQFCFKPAIDIHHLNGNHKDNRLENLMSLCKICHGKFHAINQQIKGLLN